METQENHCAADYTDGDQAIIASAGSGKTQRLINRTLHLIDVGVPPEGIMLVTYTVAAAEEMRSRIATAAANAGLPARALDSMAIGTLHACCLSLLRNHLPQYRNWRVLEDVERNLLVSSYYDALRLGDVTYASGPRQGRFAIGRMGSLRTVMDAIDFLRGRVDDVKDTELMPAPLRTVCERYEASDDHWNGKH